MSEPIWTAAWARLHQAGVVAYREAITAQPARFVGHVRRFLEELQRARTSLDHLRQLGIQDARIDPLEARYRVLHLGLRNEKIQVEGPPLLVVAGVAVGVAAIAWSIAAYQYAVHLREQTQLLEKELLARVEASREGRTLQGSTLPSASAKVGWMLLGGLALGATALVWRGRPA